MNVKKTNKILLIISILMIIISLIIGIAILNFIIFVLSNLPEMPIDGSDFSPVIQVFGYMSLPIIASFIIGGCAIVSLIIDGVMWGIYGIIRLTIKLIKEKTWKTFAIIGMILIIMMLMPTIYNTELSFSEYGYEKGVYNNYEINRKFFILSCTELNNYGINRDNQTKNKMKLKYFNSDNRSTVNDVGVESPYWTRTSYYASNYYMVGYNGIITYTGNGAKFGVRPAFTIKTDTKIVKIYDMNLEQKIYAFDI